MFVLATPGSALCSTIQNIVTQNKAELGMSLVVRQEGIQYYITCKACKTRTSRLSTTGSLGSMLCPG